MKILRIKFIGGKKKLKINGRPHQELKKFVNMRSELKIMIDNLSFIGMGNNLKEASITRRVLC